MNLQRAREIAVNLHCTLAEVCEKIAIAGSVRRQQHVCHNLDLVAIPRYALDLLGGRGQSLLDTLLAELQDRRVLIITKKGPLDKRFVLVDSDIQVDLWLCNPENFGLIYFLRTGPSEFAHAAVTPRDFVNAQGRPGLLPPGYHASGGYLYHYDRRLDTPDEETVFRILQIDPLTPPRRK